LKLHLFLDGSKIKPILIRLAKSSRSVGDALAVINITLFLLFLGFYWKKGAYFSTYLIKVAAEIAPKEKTHILIVLEDFFNLMKYPSFVIIFDKF